LDYNSPDDDLFSPSPSISPESSPESTPETTTIDLPLAGACEDRGLPPKIELLGGPKTSNAAEKRKKRKVLQSRKNQRKRRHDLKVAESSGPAAHKKAKDKFVESSCPVFTEAPTKDAKVTSTGYTALNNPYPAEAKDPRPKGTAKPPGTKGGKKAPSQHQLRSYTLEELIGEASEHKFILLKWDGR